MESEKMKNENTSDDIVKKLQTNHENLETFTSIGFKMLVEATKKSNTLPSGKVRDLYESYPSFHKVVEKQENFVLSELSKMIKRTNCRRNIRKKDDDDDKFEVIVDSNDSLLENVGIKLDELSGFIRNPEAKFIIRKVESINGSWNNNNKFFPKAATQVLNKILSQTKNIEKPQLKFKEKVNNDSNTPFEPRIKYKYNMLKPLACILENIGGFCQYSHPYEFELEKFKPSQEQMLHKPPVLYKSLKETPLVLVTSPEDVIQLVTDLEKYKEIAVDLEHHSYRSFQGFTCLMQISTRDTDYIIDALMLRTDLEMLNKVFTNSSVVKVFHGADLDILWLQRDLSLYVVNMFDTHQAAKLLNFPKLSLSYLLSHYCNVNAQKQFQLADWRVRPLPQELINYAREDTHYLLFIYDSMKNALIEKANYQTNLLESVIHESTRICLKRYVKPAYEIDGYLDLYHRSKKLFDNRQKYALQQLFEWRDTTARALDESYGYVLPDHMMLNISEVLPREAQGILACCNPVPVPVRQNFLALHQIILKAREQPLIKPVLEEQRLYRYISSVNTFDGPLQCPHDLNHEGEFRDDLPVLFSKSDAKLDDCSSSFTNYHCPKPIITVFEKSSDASHKIKLQLVEKKVLHLTPYNRYKLSKKFSESTEIKYLNKNNKHDFKKEQELSIKKKQDSQKEMDTILDKTIGRIGEKVNESTNDETEEETLNPNKRKLEVKDTKVKKLKEKIDSVFIKPNSRQEEIVNSEVQGIKKKKNILMRRKKEFQPFNYNSVDFKQYKSLESTSAKKINKRSKLKKKSGIREFKISV